MPCAPPESGLCGCLGELRDLMSFSGKWKELMCQPGETSCTHSKKPFPEAARLLDSQSFNSLVCTPPFRQLSAIAVKCSSGHMGSCLQPFKGQLWPLPSIHLHSLRPHPLSPAPRAAGALRSAQNGALAFSYLSALGSNVSSEESSPPGHVPRAWQGV